MNNYFSRVASSNSDQTFLISAPIIVLEKERNVDNEKQV